MLRKAREKALCGKIMIDADGKQMAQELLARLGLCILVGMSWCGSHPKAKAIVVLEQVRHLNGRDPLPMYLRRLNAVDDSIGAASPRKRTIGRVRVEGIPPWKRMEFLNRYLGQDVRRRLIPRHVHVRGQ